MSVYGEAQRFYSRNIADGLLKGETICVKAMLKAGQSCYLIADPNHNGGGDICHSIRVEVSHTIPTAIDNESAWAFGEGYTNGDGSRQGVNQWYACYTEQTNTDGVYDISRIKECWFKAGKENDPDTGKANGFWVAGIFDSGTELPSGENHWQLTADGKIAVCLRRPRLEGAGGGAVCCRFSAGVGQYKPGTRLRRGDPVSL